MKCKKRWAVYMAFFCLVSLPACGRKNEGSAADETLSAPDYETQEFSQNTAADDIQVVDGWEVHSFWADGAASDYVYVPHIENRVPGVLYWYDMELEEYNINRWTAANRPEGTSAIKQPSSGFFKGFCSQPKLGFNQSENTRPIEKSFYLTGFSVSMPGTGGRTGEQQHAITSQDVQCISLALYEDFYESIPELTVKVYGLPTSLWESYLGDDMVFEVGLDMKLLEQCAAEGYKDCTLLASNVAAKTGVYYIDYRELNKQGSFMQYIVVFEFDRACEYTYQVDGFNTYNVEDEAGYQAWKEKHAAQFLAGR